MIPWLTFLLAVVILLSYEFWAIETGHPTISRQVRTAAQAFGLLPFLVGLVCGGLAVHFFWIWCAS